MKTDFAIYTNRGAANTRQNTNASINPVMENTANLCTSTSIEQA
jgi:hypothetical protein